MFRNFSLMLFQLLDALTLSFSSCIKVYVIFFLFLALFETFPGRTKRFSAIQRYKIPRMSTKKSGRSDQKA